MARKSPNDTAKEKAAKQKKMVIILGVVLAGAVAFAAHTMMGMSGGSPASAPQAADPNATTTPASTPAPATPTGSALPAAPSLGSLAPATATPSASTSSPLVSAVQAPVGTGQLQSFSLFESKDPFHTGGPGTGAAASSPSSPSGGTSSGSGKAPKTPPAPPAPPPTSAVISVNGSSESVASGSNFPAASPVFQLLSLTATTAKISVVGGSYASGADTLTLKVNRSVTLVNTADGTRYTLLLMPQGTLASASGAAAAAPGPTTTTTPVTGG